LTTLGYDCDTILAGKNREPLWPKGCIGSISHTRNVSVATAAQTEDIRALGVDIESAQGLTREEWRLVLQDDEILELEGLGSSAYRLAMLAFSAKETVFKLQYPCTERYVDFREAKIELCEQQSSFQACLPGFVHEKLNHPAPFRGRYGSCGDSIVTVAWIENDCQAPRR